MEAHNYQEEIDLYLENNEIVEEITNNKVRVKKLKDIIFFEKTNLDFYDIQRNKGILSKDEYLKKVEKSRLNIYKSVVYMYLIKEAKKEEKRQKIKSNFVKIKSFFEK